MQVVDVGLSPRPSQGLQMEAQSDSANAEVQHECTTGSSVQVTTAFIHRIPFSAIYHACDTSLTALEHVQDKLLEAAGMNSVDALNACNLAPLSSRRDMALLGLIHRTALVGGPGHFRTFFRFRDREGVEETGRHRLQLEEYTGAHWTDFAYRNSTPSDYIAR